MSENSETSDDRALLPFDDGSGTMLEDLPTPAQSSKHVDRAEQARLNGASQARRQPSLFGAGERDGGDDA